MSLVLIHFITKSITFTNLALFPTTQPLAATFLLSGYELNFFFFLNRNDTMQYLVVFCLVSLMPPSSFTQSEILCISVCIHVCVLWEGGEEWFGRKITHDNFLKRFEGLTLEVLVFFFVV